MAIGGTNFLAGLLPTVGDGVVEISEGHPVEGSPLALAIEDCPSTETVFADASTVYTAFEVEFIGRISDAYAVVEGIAIGSESSGAADVLTEDASLERASVKGISVDGGCSVTLL